MQADGPVFESAFGSFFLQIVVVSWGGGGGGEVQWNHCVHVCVLALSRRYLLNRSIYFVYIGGGGGGGVGTKPGIVVHHYEPEFNAKKWGCCLRCLREHLYNQNMTVPSISAELILSQPNLI